MQVVWEANTADFRKRKRAARACLDCQKRKKKCPHTFDRSGGKDAVFNNNTTSELDPGQHSDPVRFIGDLDPESVIRDLSTRARGNPRPSRLGVFVQKEEEEEEHHQRLRNPVSAETTSQATTQSLPGAEIYVLSTQFANAHQRQYLQDVGAFRVLPSSTVDVLVVNYFSYIDSILEPLIDGDVFLKEFRQGAASNFLINAICLVAAKTPEVALYLQLSEHGPVLQPLAFARALYTGLDAAVRAGGAIKDRLLQIQVLGLLSLHNDGPGGLEDASLHLAQAIHLAHTAGFHIDSQGRQRDDYHAKLYWCLWSLDKMNACLGGRPIMIAGQFIQTRAAQIHFIYWSQMIFERH